MIVFQYMQTLGARRFLVIGALFVGVGNGCMGFLDTVTNGNVFFGLSIFIRIVTALGNYFNRVERFLETMLCSDSVQESRD